MGACLGNDRERETASVPDTHSERNTETTGLLSSTGSSSSYSVRREEVPSETGPFTGGASRPPQPAASSSALSSTNYSHHPSEYEQVSGSEAAPQFQYLDKSYSLETPSCLIPQVNEIFKSVCERYDIAVTNREKVDEALQLFKKVLEVDLALPIVDCFRAWRSHLTNPKFTVTRSDMSRDVKKITVRAEEVPRTKRKAQKHIRDLLDACHLFLQQRDFLQREITNGLEQLEHMARDIPTLCKGVRLSLFERKNVPQIVKLGRDQFAQFPATIDRFWNEVFALLHEINSAVHVLEDST